jgi:hypothetical protein
MVQLTNENCGSFNTVHQLTDHPVGQTLFLGHVLVTYPERDGWLMWMRKLDWLDSWYLEIECMEVWSSDWGTNHS